MTVTVSEMDRRRWSAMTVGLGVDKVERERWACQIMGLATAMLGSGFIALVLAQTWVPVWFGTALFVSVFTGILWGSHRLCTERAQQWAAVTETAASATREKARDSMAPALEPAHAGPNGADTNKAAMPDDDGPLEGPVGTGNGPGGTVSKATAAG